MTRILTASLSPLHISMTLKNKIHEHCLLPATRQSCHVCRQLECSLVPFKDNFTYCPLRLSRHKADLTSRRSQNQENAVEGLITWESEAQSKVSEGPWCFPGTQSTSFRPRRDGLPIQYLKGLLPLSTSTHHERLPKPGCDSWSPRCAMLKELWVSDWRLGGPCWFGMHSTQLNMKSNTVVARSPESAF